mgnify:CR=1 FL=1
MWDNCIHNTIIDCLFDDLLLRAEDEVADLWILFSQRHDVILLLRIFTQEMELLHHSNRQCTVVSQTPMTLLTVGRDRFFQIFMSSQDDESLPDHIKFLRYVCKIRSALCRGQLSGFYIGACLEYIHCWENRCLCETQYFGKWQKISQN